MTSIPHVIVHHPASRAERSAGAATHDRRRCLVSEWTCTGALKSPRSPDSRAPARNSTGCRAVAAVVKMAPCVCKPSRAFLPSVPGPKGPGVVRSGYGRWRRLSVYWLKGDGWLGASPHPAEVSVSGGRSCHGQAPAIRMYSKRKCTFPQGGTCRGHTKPRLGGPGFACQTPSAWLSRLGTAHTPAATSTAPTVLSVTVRTARAPATGAEGEPELDRRSRP